MKFKKENEMRKKKKIMHLFFENFYVWDAASAVCFQNQSKMNRHGWHVHFRPVMYNTHNHKF